MIVVIGQGGRGSISLIEVNISKGVTTMSSCTIEKHGDTAHIILKFENDCYVVNVPASDAAFVSSYLMLGSECQMIKDPESMERYVEAVMAINDLLH